MIDFTQNPLRTRTPILPSNGIPPSNEGADGDVRQDVNTGILFYKQPITGWVILTTPSQAAAAAFPLAMNNRGMASGAYGSYPATQVVINASNCDSATLNLAMTTATGQLFSLLDTIPLPAGNVGPDGWYELFIEWQCASSAVAKSLQLVWDHTNANFIDTQTTNQSSSILVRISNRNDTTTNIASGGPVPGGKANFSQFLTMDLSKEHSVALFASFGTTPGAGDAIKVSRWSVTACNPPVYSKSRLLNGTKMFYGANTHFDDSQSVAMHIAGLKTMGMKLMRMTWEGGTSLATMVNYAQALKTDGTGIQMLCCLDLGTNNYPDEGTAYAQTYTAVLPVVQALAAVGVKLFECGNEMDTKAGINTGDPQGGLPTDFSNTLVPIFRGVQRGAIDAVHAVPGCLAGSNAYTVCSIGLAYMMFNGTQPDGTSGHPVVRPDWISWHNYEDYGPLMGVELGNNRQWVNIYEYLNRQFGLPIIISEWNGKLSDTDSQRANWASRFMYEAFVNRYKYNIAAIIVYELYGSPWCVLDGVANTPIVTFGQTVQSFIAANVDTGL